MIWHKDEYQITAGYMLVEFADESWSNNETNTLRFQVQPKAAGDFTFQVRSAMGAGGDQLTAADELRDRLAIPEAQHRIEPTSQSRLDE